MKTFLKTLKILGVIVLIAISYIGVAVYCIRTLDNELQQDSVAEAQEKFGSFASGELIKKVEVSPIKLWIIKSASALNPKFKSVTEVDFYSIAYKSDGLIVTGLLTTPKKPGKYPCLIYNRGGNRDLGRLSYKQASSFMIPYSLEGYTVIASNYRGNSGSEGKEEFGGADLNDVFNLIPALGQLDNADTSKIGLLGHSRGGIMTYKAMKQKGIFKTAVVIAGSADMFNSIKKKAKHGN